MIYLLVECDIVRRSVCMKQKMFFVFVLFIVSTPYVIAQVQATVGLDVMTFGGVQLSDPETGETANEARETLKFPFPYGQLAYNFDLGMFDIGLGAKAYTFIVVSAIYPLVYADVSLGPVVVHGGLGGGFFWFVSPFGQKTLSGNVFLPEVGAYVRIGKAFQLGVTSVFFISESTDIAMPYVICISGRFVFDLFGPSEK